MKSIKASALLLTQNSQSSLKRCLDSLKRFDEVVLVDGGSTDNTLALARGYSNVKIFVHPWPGFIEQRNYSISQATHPWCLMIDSDEKLTDELVGHIEKVLENPRYPMYQIMRTEFYLGMALEKGLGRSNFHKRLFLKDRVQYTGGNHHRHLIDGIHESKQRHLIGKFPKHLRILHDECYCLEDWIMKLPRFSILGAREKFQKGMRVFAFDLFLFSIPYFLKVLWQNRTLGRVGLIVAFQTTIFRSLTKLGVYTRKHFPEYQNHKIHLG